MSFSILGFKIQGFVLPVQRLVPHISAEYDGDPYRLYNTVCELPRWNACGKSGRMGGLVWQVSQVEG